MLARTLTEPTNRPRCEIALHLQFYKESGAELIMGSGRFVAPKTIEVALNDGGTRTLLGKEVVVNVGSHAAIPDVPGLSTAQPLTHIEALELDELPPHLIVLGGGYTGIELAQTYRRFGSRVTIIEPGAQIMGREDPDVAAEMERLLCAEGIEILLGAKPSHVHGLSGDAVAVTMQMAGGERTAEGSHLLVGRPTLSEPARRLSFGFWLALAGYAGIATAVACHAGLILKQLACGSYFAFGGGLYFLLSGHRRALWVMVPAFLQMLWHFHDFDAGDFTDVAANPRGTDGPVYPCGLGHHPTGPASCATHPD